MKDLQLNLDKKHYRPGEEVKGVIVWYFEEPIRDVQVRLFWYTRGKGNEDVHVVETYPLDAPQQQGQASFRFTLPEAPYSFSGKLISLVWAVEVVLEPHKECRREDIIVAPDQTEINICQAG